MGWVLGKREKEIIRKLFEFLDVISKTLLELRRTIEAYLKQEETRFTELVEVVRKSEHDADNLRREVETLMYGGAFLPNSRGDLLGIIESADRVANKAEYIADILDLERPAIPPVFAPNFFRLVDLSIETYEALKLAINYLFEDLDKVTEKILLVEQKEHDVDIVERSMIKQIFALDIPHSQKLHLKELVRSIADIADRAEDCSDRVQVVSLKRRV